MVNICDEFQITWTLASLFLPLWLFSGKGEKLFPDIDVAIPVNDTRDCWHQENGISSFVCHRAHKSRRQNTLGQVRSWTFEMSKLYEKVSHLTFPDNSVATSNCPQTCWSNLSQWGNCILGVPETTIYFFAVISCEEHCGVDHYPSEAQ